jgi:hypothetical protein
MLYAGDLPRNTVGADGTLKSPETGLLQQICQGAHIIVHAEGRKDAFRFLFTRLPEAPQVVIYVTAIAFPSCVGGEGGGGAGVLWEGAETAERSRGC